MDQSANLQLPYIMAAQAQKHITHNEAIRALDALVQLSVKGRGLTAPPVSVSDGERYIVASPATGAWSGKDGQIAAFQDNAWIFYQPLEGWLTWIGDENRLLVWSGLSWDDVSGGAGGASNIINTSAQNAQTRFELLEEELTLSGSFVDSTVVIPDRAIVFAVTTRTTQAITGAASYDCGIAGDTGKYGGSLGTGLDSSNSGVTGPTAFYASTPVRLTANGADFTGGSVRVSIHYMLCDAPAS